MCTVWESETHQTAETCVYDPDEFRKTKVFHLNGTFLQQPEESNTNDLKLNYNVYIKKQIKLDNAIKKIIFLSQFLTIHCFHCAAVSVVLYLYSLFKVEHLPVDLVPNHSCIHLRIHHLYGWHGLKQSKPSTTEERLVSVLYVCLQKFIKHWILKTNTNDDIAERSNE